MPRPNDDGHVSFPTRAFPSLLLCRACIQEPSPSRVWFWPLALGGPGASPDPARLAGLMFALRGAVQKEQEPWDDPVLTADRFPTSVTKSAEEELRRSKMWGDPAVTPSSPQHPTSTPPRHPFPSTACPPGVKMVFFSETRLSAVGSSQETRDRSRGGGVDGGLPARRGLQALRCFPWFQLFTFLILGLIIDSMS